MTVVHSADQVIGSIPTCADYAARLNGNQYREEGSRELWSEMKASGHVAVFGGSDDLIYFAGAADDEVGASDGSVFHLTSEGQLRNECGDDDCPHYRRLKRSAAFVRSRFDHDGYTWTYETDIPHATFDVLEDDDTYCRGIVFALSDLATAAAETSSVGTSNASEPNTSAVSS